MSDSIFSAAVFHSDGVFRVMHFGSEWWRNGFVEGVEEAGGDHIWAHPLPLAQSVIDDNEGHRGMMEWLKDQAADCDGLRK